jgi:hypothetical protein
MYLSDREGRDIIDRQWPQNFIYYICAIAALTGSRIKSSTISFEALRQHKCKLHSMYSLMESCLPLFPCANYTSASTGATVFAHPITFLSTKSVIFKMEWSNENFEQNINVMVEKSDSFISYKQKISEQISSTKSL